MGVTHRSAGYDLGRHRGAVRRHMPNLDMKVCAWCSKCVSWCGWCVCCALEMCLAVSVWSSLLPRIVVRPHAYTLRRRPPTVADAHPTLRHEMHAKHDLSNSCHNNLLQEHQTTPNAMTIHAYLRAYLEPSEHQAHCQSLGNLCKLG